MEMNFCRRCGKPLMHQSENYYKCENGHPIYANTSPCVGVFLMKEDGSVVLAERGIEPHKGKLDTFGGFVAQDESLEAAGARELQEELSLQADEYKPIQYLMSALSHVDYKEESLPIMSILYWSRLKTTRELHPSDDVAAVHTIQLHEVDPDKLHADDIRLGIKALQALFPKVESKR